MSIINPYASVNWNNYEHIMSCSHQHGFTEDHLRCILAGGIRHAALSNYFPSNPTYPLEDFFETIPDNVIGSPNAEHGYYAEHGLLHTNSLGSFFKSGKPKGEYPAGVGGESWRTVFPKIIDQLQYPDAGGITINHPNWSNLDVRMIYEMLDSDDRVLGIEFFNGGSERGQQNGWDLDTWDTILCTGRRCWGFCVADHDGKREGEWWGRNILLVPNFTEYDCLRAYRIGAFYGQILTSNLTFANISLNDRVLSVSAPNATSVKVVSNGETKKTVSGTTLTYTVPYDAIYVRVEATNGEDSIYSQPIMFKERRKTSMLKRILRYD